MPETPSQLLRWSQQLSDPDTATRREAARQIMQAGEPAVGAAISLVKAVGDQDEEVVNSATEALENLGPPRVEDAAELAKLLHAPQSDMGYWAATLLGRLGDQAATAVKSLAAVVTAHPQLAVRERSAWALGQIGPAARPAKEVLEAVTRGDAPRLARLARESLEQID